MLFRSVLSDQLLIRITTNPGEGFLDHMISLVEGATRQKTPNEIALTILLSALTFIFLLVIITLKPFGVYANVAFSITTLIALRGVAYRPVGAAALLRRNLFIYSLGGIIIPFIGIKAVDLLINAIHLV